jgi:outer membrane protein assembly factor BamA
MVSFSRSRAEEILKEKGYLGEQVLFHPMLPYKRAESYAVDVTAVVTAGPKYKISALKVDGGPLFEGRDLMRFVRTKVGDTAGDSP